MNLDIKLNWPNTSQAFANKIMEVFQTSPWLVSRRNAARNLLTVHKELGLKYLWRCLKHGDPLARQVALEVLLDNQRLPLQKLLEIWLMDKDKNVQAAAESHIKKQPTTARIESLIELIRESKHGSLLRQRSVYAIIKVLKMDYNPDQFALRRAIGFLQDLLMYDYLRIIKDAAGRQLAEISEIEAGDLALKALFGVVKKTADQVNDHSATKAAALLAIAFLDTEKAVPFCEELLLASVFDLALRKALVTCLGNVRADYLLKFLDQKEDLLIQQTARKMLAVYAIGDPYLSRRLAKPEDYLPN